MKQIFKNLSSLLLALIMLLNLSIPAFAADSAITFKGAQEGFAFQPGSEYTATDLFDSFKNVMPGDKLTETIQIKNEASDCDYIKLYMRAVVHDENGNPLTYSEAFEQLDGKDQSGENQNPVDGQRDETVATMQDFLSQLTMRIYNGTKMIYNASPAEAGALADNVLLGTLQKGESLNLKVELDVPVELGNKYANRVGEVDWVFLAECFENGTIEVTKRTFMMQGEEKVVLEGLNNVYYVGLFLDEEGTTPYPDTKIQAIEMKGTSAATVKFTGLMDGTYYVFETLEDGTAIKPGELQEDDFFVFQSQFSTGQKVVIDQSHGQTEGKVILDNVYEELPENPDEIKGVIKVKKSVFQGSDRITVDDTFYAGLFSRSDGAYVLQEVKKLKQNDTIEFEVNITGSAVIKSLKYWVFETDKDGNRIDKEAFPYEVSGEGVVTLTEEEPEQQIEIINTIKEAETEPPTETETETETVTEVETESESEKEAVKTGDETPLEAYIMLTITAVIVLMVGLIRRRKKQ